VSPWLWVAAGLAAWFLAAVAVALVIGPFLAGDSRRPAQDDERTRP
jgi:hypothetical protein